MKKLTLFFITSIVITSCCAQNLKRNTVYFEAGGAAIFYSVNYERLLLPHAKHNIGLRGGLSYINFFDSPRRQGIAVPIGLSYIKKLKTKYFEAGLSFSPIYYYYHFTIEGDKYAELILVPAVRVGIRKQPIDNHFFWNALLQAGMTAVHEYKTFTWEETDKNFFPFASLGVGYAFLYPGTKKT